ncbi:MAG TPA: hypothetical protein VGJ64_00050, partial [Gemmatimonadaceae bacterium]
LLAGCATAGTTGNDTSSPSSTVGRNPGNPLEVWGIKTREHVDLWLHGFAMVQDDSSLVPYFRRGYKANLNAVKSRSNVVTQLDANNSRLHGRFALNAQLVNAQFLALYFDSFDEMASAIDLAYRADGNPRQAASRQAAETIALVAGYFPAQPDRDWARLFVQSLRDEDTRFYRGYWDQQQRERGAVFTAVNSLWQNSYRARFQTFLNNTSQAAGEVYLSLPLDGEGRTLSAGKRQNATAVTFPLRSSDAPEAIYVIAHELVSSLVSTAVNDNTTPNDRRLGVADRYVANGTVRAGAMLLQKIAPELVTGYASYYLQSANRNAGTSPVATLATVFALPDSIRDAISKQLDVVLGGI